MNNNNSPLRHLPWAVLAVVGACALGVVALRRGEAINALWIVVAAVALYLVAYRYYSLFIATKVMQLDPNRATPALLNNDGLDYVPTNKHILFGHHFAAIAGAGPLVGPVLAAQMGYLPGTMWIIIGVVFALLLAVMFLGGGNGKVDGMADVDEPFDAFAGGYPVPPMPGQTLPELADVVHGTTETDDRKDVE